MPAEQQRGTVGDPAAAERAEHDGRAADLDRAEKRGRPHLPGQRAVGDDHPDGGP